MEPSLIYAASNKLKGKVKWVGIYAETEWIYFGAENDVNDDFAILEIMDYFHKRPVFIAIDRKTSAIVQANELRNFLHGILGFKTFSFGISRFRV